MHISRTIARTGAALALSALVGCAHHGNAHHGHGGSAFAGGIAVTGTGEAYGAPDIARTTAGVEVRANTAEEATAQATVQMDRLLEALKGVGIAPSDLRTQGYSVSYERDYAPPPAPVPVRGQTKLAAAAQPSGRYLVTNSVEITVRNVAELGKVLSTATAGGANNVWGISFDIENREPLVSRARVEAFSQARARAEQVAALAGLELGALIAVNDANEGGTVIAPRSAFAALREAVPVERGELAVSHTVHLQYAIAGEAKPPKHAHAAAPKTSAPSATVAAPSTSVSGAVTTR